jgi:hypothetical protein
MEPQHHYVKPNRNRRITVGSPRLAPEDVPVRFAAAQEELLRDYNAAGRCVYVRHPNQRQLESITTRRALLALVMSCTRPVL